VCVCVCCVCIKRERESERYKTMKCKAQPMDVPTRIAGAFTPEFVTLIRVDLDN
jgi:hypothetical protein